MAKKNNLIYIIGGLVLIIALVSSGVIDTGLFAITGDETMTRTSDKVWVKPSETFTITYEVFSGTPPWGVSIIDAVAGGCQFPAGTGYQTVMISDEGNTRTATITAPAVEATCVFTGDYKFGDLAVVSLNALSVDSCIPNTDADTDCDKTVDRTELGLFIIDWINGLATRDDLGSAIMAWV